MSTAIRITTHGGPEVLEVHEEEVGEPGPTQIRVRQSAVGVNFIDTYHRTGLYPVDLPSGLGMEAAGVIEAVGENVRDLAVGQRVAYASGPPGAYAQVRIVAADRTVPLPPAIADETAAGCLLKGMTVEYLIRRAFRVTSGMTVLWHAAAGGVGLLACQWLRRLGVEVIGTVGSAAKAAIASEHGCTHPVIYSDEDFVARVRAITRGRGVSAVFDSVGAATLDGSLACLERRGMLLAFGNASGPPKPLDVLQLAQRGSLFLTRPKLFDYVSTRAELLACAAALFDVVASGDVEVMVRQRFALHEAADAHRSLEARATIGSTLLMP